jgi:hypothetical protein
VDCYRAEIGVSLALIDAGYLEQTSKVIRYLNEKFLP